MWTWHCCQRSRRAVSEGERRNGPGRHSFALILGDGTNGDAQRDRICDDACSHCGHGNHWHWHWRCGRGWPQGGAEASERARSALHGQDGRQRRAGEDDGQVHPGGWRRLWRQGRRGRQQPEGQERDHRQDRREPPAAVRRASRSELRRGDPELHRPERNQGPGRHAGLPDHRAGLGRDRRAPGQRWRARPRDGQLPHRPHERPSGRPARRARGQA